MIATQVSRPIRSARASGPIGCAKPSFAIVSIASGLGDALHQRVGRLVDERHQDAVRDEAGEVVRLRRLLAELAGQLDDRRGGLVRGLHRPDHLDEPQHRHRVEEVHADHAVGPRRDRGERRDRDRARVGGEDRSGGQHAVGPAEELLLRRGVLGDRLDHQVGRRRGRRRARSARACPRRRRRAGRGSSRSPRRPRSTAPGYGSCSDTRRPEAATTCAMPAPIWPGPDDEDMLELHGDGTLPFTSWRSGPQRRADADGDRRRAGADLAGRVPARLPGARARPRRLHPAGALARRASPGPRPAGRRSSRSRTASSRGSRRSARAATSTGSASSTRSTSSPQHWSTGTGRALIERCEEQLARLLRRGDALGARGQPARPGVLRARRLGARRRAQVGGALGCARTRGALPEDPDPRLIRAPCRCQTAVRAACGRASCVSSARASSNGRPSAPRRPRSARSPRRRSSSGSSAPPSGPAARRSASSRRNAPSSHVSPVSSSTSRSAPSSQDSSSSSFPFGNDQSS